jgi:flagellar basal-body rod protein FlgB
MGGTFLYIAVIASSMDLNQLPIFSLITEKMNFLTKRQEAIAGNLANADTPGYRARTVKAPDFSRYIAADGSHGDLKIAKTDKGHIDTTPKRLGGVSSMEAAIHGREQYSPDGNSVDVSGQVMQMADTQMQYNLASNIYKKQVQLLKLAIGRTGG